MNYPTSSFIVGKLLEEKCGRFVDSRKYNQIRFDSSTVIDLLVEYDIYQTSLLCGYLDLFDVYYKYINDKYETDLHDLILCNSHSLYSKNDGLLYGFMFVTHHITELILKTVFHVVFEGNIFKDRNNKECNINKSHFTKDIWECIEKQVCIDFPNKCDKMKYFDKFFNDKDAVCPDGFSGRYYLDNKCVAYLPCTYFIDIVSMHGTVHKLYDVLCRGPMSISSLYRNGWLGKGIEV